MSLPTLPFTINFLLLFLGPFKLSRQVFTDVLYLQKTEKQKSNEKRCKKKKKKKRLEW